MDAGSSKRKAVPKGTPDVVAGATAPSDRSNRDPTLDRKAADLDRREQELEAREAELHARPSPARLLWGLRLLPSASVELAVAAVLVVSVCVLRGTARDATTITAAALLGLMAVLRVTNLAEPP